MRKINTFSLLVVLLLPALAFAQEEYHAISAPPQQSELGRFLWSDGSGSNSVADPCTTFSSELTAPSFCLRGDGTSTGSLSLSAVGSPTTQTMAWCGNGLSCGPVSRQIVSASNYFQTASMAQPSGSWWACVRGIVDAPLPTAHYVQQAGSWLLQITTTGALNINVTGGTNFSSSAGLVVGGASQLLCLAWHQVGSGSNVATAYLDGVQVAQNSTETNLASVSVPMMISGGGLPLSRLGFAMFGTGDPSATLFSRLASATAPTPQGTRGEQLTFARASAASCIAPDGSVTWLQPGRPCISGGIRVRPAVTNLLTFSEQFDNAAWTKVGVTVTPNTSVAPDGSMTADTVSFTAADFPRIIQTITANGGAYALASTLSAVSGTQLNASVQIFDQTASTTICNSGGTTLTTAKVRLSCTVSSTTSGHTLQLRAFAGTTTGMTGSVVLWGSQAETGSIASDPCRSEGTSATCAAETASVPMPSGANPNEGCTKVCVVPNWTGANPLTSLAYILVGNSGAAGVRFQGFGASSVNVNAFEGVHTPLVTGSLTAGAKSCFVTKWSASANSFSVSNLTTATAGTPTSFSGFGAFGNLLQIGSNYGGTGQPNAATISDIQFGASAGACN